MEEQFGASLVGERLLTSLSGAFAGLALGLACIGLYGVMLYDVARRVRDIGIRLALGASPSQILGAGPSPFDAPDHRRYRHRRSRGRSVVAISVELSVRTSTARFRHAVRFGSSSGRYFPDRRISSSSRRLASRSVRDLEDAVGLKRIPRV